MAQSPSHPQADGPEGHARLAELVAQLRQAVGAVENLPSAERDIAQRALDGATVSEIASAHGVSEAAVWSTLSNAARFASGQLPAGAVELGGLGSDFGAGEDEAEDAPSPSRL
jgi:DNA-directed RNA polymerase specialized sigma24 family protein